MKNKMKVESEKIGTQTCRYDISPASHLAPRSFSLSPLFLLTTSRLELSPFTEKNYNLQTKLAHHTRLPPFGGEVDSRI
jgi:hypothetical protein